MTEKELRDRLFRTINLLHLEGWETETVVDAIIAHIKEAGWKSPEEVGTISQWFERGRKSVLRTNPSGCSCLFDEQDNIVQVCGAHQDWYEEKLKEGQPMDLPLEAP